VEGEDEKHDTEDVAAIYLMQEQISMGSMQRHQCDHSSFQWVIALA
jgi:hypothetical protein